MAAVRISSPVRISSIEELRALIGRTIGPSDFRVVTQNDVDAFAQLTGDLRQRDARRRIHERARCLRE